KSPLRAGPAANAKTVPVARAQRLPSDHAQSGGLPESVYRPQFEHSLGYVFNSDRICIRGHALRARNGASKLSLRLWTRDVVAKNSWTNPGSRRARRLSGN